MNKSRTKVLVAEDNLAMAGLAEYVLQQAGCDVTICNSGSKAVARVEEEAFDFIVTDYQMPGADGEDVIRAARSNSANAKTPIVLCSAKGFELDTEKLYDTYEISKVVTKPYSPTQLVELVNTLVHQEPASV